MWNPHSDLPQSEWQWSGHGPSELRWYHTREFMHCFWGSHPCSYLWNYNSSWFLAHNSYLFINPIYPIYPVIHPMIYPILHIYIYVCVCVWDNPQCYFPVNPMGFCSNSSKSCHPKIASSQTFQGRPWQCPPVRSSNVKHQPVLISSKYTIVNVSIQVVLYYIILCYILFYFTYYTYYTYVYDYICRTIDGRMNG